MLRLAQVAGRFSARSLWPANKTGSPQFALGQKFFSRDFRPDINPALAAAIEKLEFP
jgi:hypothetical protein